MNYDFNKLRGIIKEKGFSESEFAKKLNISKESFSRKLNSLSRFNADEIKKMIEILNVESQFVYDIFFTVVS